MNIKSTLLSSLLILSSISTTLSAQETVTIGTQVWMTKNLDVDKFRNGDPIPYAPSGAEWIAAAENGLPAWCYYDNDPVSGMRHGKLYNWYAVNDPRGIAPEGFHVPNSIEGLKVALYAPTRQDSAEIQLRLQELAGDFQKAADDKNFAATHSDTEELEVFFNETNHSEVYVESYPPEILKCINKGALGKVLGPFSYGGFYRLIKISHDIEEHCLCNARHILIRDEANGKSRLESMKKTIMSKRNFEEMATRYSEDPGSAQVGGGLGWFGRGEMVKPFEDLCFNAERGKLNIVETAFGWHLVEVLDFAPCLRLAQISKQIYPSEETILNAQKVIEKNFAQAEWELLIQGLGDDEAFKLKSRYGWEEDTTQQMLIESLKLLNAPDSELMDSNDASEEPTEFSFPPANGDNSSGFNAFPVGCRHIQGMFYGKGTSVGFWSMDEIDGDTASSWWLQSISNTMSPSSVDSKGSGFSVRCLKN